jgi:hypothetical protein
MPVWISLLAVAVCLLVVFMVVRPRGRRHDMRRSDGGTIGYGTTSGHDGRSRSNDDDGRDGDGDGGSDGGGGGGGD